MDRDDLETLARYNAERSRGIIHFTEWRERMEKLQEIFDNEQRQEMIAAGAIELPGGGWILTGKRRHKREDRSSRFEGPDTEPNI